MSYTPGRSDAKGRAIPQETEAVFGIQALGSSLHMQVEFHPDALPRRIWRREQDSVDCPGTWRGDLLLSPFHVADLVLAHPRAGFHGIAWEWPDDQAQEDPRHKREHLQRS